MSLKGLNILGAAPKLPKPRVVNPHSADFEQVVKEQTQATDKELAEGEAVLEKTPGGVIVENPTERNIDNQDEKLSRLVDDEFPFDESQLVAIYGLVKEQYGCLIGAAGTGKTTTTKKLVDLLRDGLDEVDVSQYWKRGVSDDDDDYHMPERLIPSIALVSFTGRATQMIKKNFPTDWHPNIMTIHRALGFYPEFYDDYNPETNQLEKKRRFVPAYNADNLMPWDIIVIDEAGMLGLDLWHQLWAACKPTCRIIMIGDINQLPPTHGKSILGFALSNWPTWELTHVHRQQGANNSIVDNAHRILKGLTPVSDCPTQLSLKTQKDMLGALNFMVKDKDWRFLTIQVDEEHRKASTQIRMALKLLQDKLYDPNRDVVITPINGFEQTAPGYSLGQAPMNQALVTQLNHDNPRYFIDAGRERQNFAVGDKVMATINDYEAGITNGMTGIIESIVENGAYIGDVRRFGLISEVNDYLAGLVDEDDDDVEFSLEEMVMDSEAGLEEMKKQKEKRDSGPASHIVTVRFGEGEHSKVISFASKSQVASLILAYVATCHKMQGGECPLVFVIVHQGHKRPLTREWYYTGVTRASQRCVVFYTRQGSGFALGKQTIRGTTLQQKVKVFADLQKVGIAGASVKVKIPQPRTLEGFNEEDQAATQSNMLATRQEIQSADDGSARLPELREETAPPPTPVAAASPTQNPERAPESPASDSRTVVQRINIKNLTINIVGRDSPVAEKPRERDGGELRAERTEVRRDDSQLPVGTREEVLALPAPRWMRPESQPHDGKSAEQIEHEAWVASQKVPAPTPKPKAPAKPLSLAQLLAARK